MKGTRKDCDFDESKAKEVLLIKTRAQNTWTLAADYEVSETSDDYASQIAMPTEDILLRAVFSKWQKDMYFQTWPPISRYFELTEEFAPSSWKTRKCMSEF